MQELLKPEFPEVCCEQLIGRNSAQYSSFKVTINETNFKKAMNPALWPYGACINKFFQVRKKTTPEG